MSATAAFERYLLSESLLSQDTLAKAHASLKPSEVTLEALCALNLLPEEALYRALAQFCEMEYRTLSEADADPALSTALPVNLALHYEAVPLSEDDDVLTLAICDPLDSARLDDLRAALGRRIRPVVAMPESIAQISRAIYGIGAETLGRIGPASNVQLESTGHQLDETTDDPSVVTFVNGLLSEAIASDATDVHIEPFESNVRVRFRIDGLLHPVPISEGVRSIHGAIVSRLKVMADLNIAEKRLPQDGKIRAVVGGKAYDLRISILPTPHGESVDIRVLSRASMFLSLTELGYLPDELNQIQTALDRPHGVLLLTGPTGSGKTTTLYAALNSLNADERKTITIEDPIEYQLHGITQMQVSPQIGFDFATGLRSMLRHDPDIMMVGEIRDYETAEMAIRASLTGHLVFSTLHTNDAPGAVTRLADMGVEPFLIASTLNAVVGQRLVRRNCEECARPVDVDDALMRQIQACVKGTIALREGKGCEACRNTGHRGRTAIAEVLPMTPELRDVAAHRASLPTLWQLGRAAGMRTLREAGWARAAMGVTSAGEVLRVTADAAVGAPPAE